VADFLSIERLSLGPWQAFERAVQRLFVHAGFDDVGLVGQAGDEGADVVADYRGRMWVMQAKFRSTGQLVGPTAIDEVTVAVDRYGADVAVVATNSGFTSSAVALAQKRGGDMGMPFYLWDGDKLLARCDRLRLYAPFRQEPRPYQRAAIDAINERVWQGARTGLLLMATGLGKTRVAAGVIEQWLFDHPHHQVLLLAPSLALVPQLEASLWPYLSKMVPTHVLTGAEKPAFEGGVTVGTYQTLQRRDGNEGQYPLVIVDEAHHAPADGFRRLLAALDPTFLLGMTATPWRGDERQVAEVFGDPTYSVSVVEGMQLGFLADVDYRMLIDDIDWAWVHSNLRGSVTVKELNQRLFIPERDDAVVAKIREHLNDVTKPRCVVFCRSIDHSETVGRLLKADGFRVRVIHSRLDKREAARSLHEFRVGTVPIIVTVDMLNEGIDVPDVNLIVFLRVTHSRRIFLQQLGRGLRLAEGKINVRILDFVSDIRRIAAAMDMNREAALRRDAPRPGEIVRYPTGTIVHFDGDAGLSFFNEYLADIAELDGEDDQARLRFPSWV
jgi:superfamily II DNA or RNA helicase